MRQSNSLMAPDAVLAEVQKIRQEVTIPLGTPFAGNQYYASRWQRIKLRWWIKWHVARLAIANYPTLGKAIQVIRLLKAFRKKTFGGNGRRKFVYKNGQYWFGAYIPPFPSPGFDKYLLTEFNHYEPLNAAVNAHQQIILAITTHCPMRCEHCFEWANLNKAETFSRGQLAGMLRQLQDEGLGQISLSGGEPMLRFDDILHFLREARPGTSWWLFTSGLRLTPTRAQALKSAGLSGVLVSLDHYEENEHNRFRGHPEAFQSAIHAVANARHAGLVTALSLCLTRNTANTSFLYNYARRALAWGADFIQILEPMEIGHYAGKDVALMPEQIALVEDFYLTLNHQKEFYAYPVILYHGFHQRRVGCQSAGRRNVYIDSAGYVQSCPFCHSQDFKVTEWLAQPLEKRSPVSSCPQFLQT